MKSISFFLLLILGCISCFSKSEKLGDKNDTYPGVFECNTITDYGNNVYHFPFCKFGESLSSFLQTHPELEVITISGDSGGMRGSNTGYFVIFREKK